MHTFVQREPGVLICKLCDDFEEASIHEVQPFTPKPKRGAVEAIELAESVLSDLDYNEPGYMPNTTEGLRSLAEAVRCLAREVMENARGEV